MNFICSKAYSKKEEITGYCGLLILLVSNPINLVNLTFNDKSNMIYTQFTSTQ